MSHLPRQLHALCGMEAPNVRQKQHFGSFTFFPVDILLYSSFNCCHFSTLFRRMIHPIWCGFAELELQMYDGRQQNDGFEHLHGRLFKTKS
jgi:hypothetical protein